MIHFTGGAVRDLRYALRQLRRAPGFTVVAAGTLALGIGATTAIFLVMQALLLEPLPYPGSERIMYVHQSEEGEEGPGNLSIRNFFDVAERAEGFEALAATGGWFDPSFMSDGAPVRLDGAFGSTDLFRVLGVDPVLGRGFTADDAEDVVVVSHSFWRTHLGGRNGAIGEAILLDGEPRTVIGVMPEGFRGPMHLDAQLWSLFPVQPGGQRQSRNMAVIGRLAPGVDEGWAANELASISAGLRAEHPEVLSGTELGLRSLREEMFGEARAPLGILLGAASLLLLVGCVNLSSLMLARAMSRRREVGVRLALGADRIRIIRQWVAEGLLLALAGAFAGVLLAQVGTRVLVNLGPPILRTGEIGLGWGGLLFAVGAAVVAAAVIQLLPASQVARLRPAASLGERSGTRSSRSDLRLRDGLVAMQLAVTVVLLVGAGAFIREFAVLQAIEPGFQPAEVVTAEVELPGTAFSGPEGPVVFFQEVLREVQGVPGVESASATSLLPFSGNYFTTGVRVEGRSYASDDYGEMVDRVVVAPSYFSTMRIPVSRGRPFAASDRGGSGGVAIINEHLADRLFGSDDPIGRDIRMSFADSSRTVVGVVGDVRMESLHEAPRGQVYLPHAQSGGTDMTLVVRGAGDALGLVPGIRASVARVRGEQPVGTVATMDSLLAEARRPIRFMSVLLSALAAVALGLAVAGLVAVTAYFVERRKREFAIRIALGARGGDIVWSVLRRGLLLVGAGLAVGAGLVFAMSSVLAARLSDVNLGDPWVLSGVAALLAFVSLLAGAVPAASASRVEPIRALEAE